MNIIQKGDLLLKELRSALIVHDWWYHMSDDYKYYTKGRTQESYIKYLLINCKTYGVSLQGQELLNTYKPKDVFF